MASSEISPLSAPVRITPTPVDDSPPPVSPSSTDLHASRYYSSSAMSEPAMVCWTTGQVRRMRSVLEMRLGVLACSSLDKFSLYALSCDASAPASASASPTNIPGPYPPSRQSTRTRTRRRQPSHFPSASSGASFHDAPVTKHGDCFSPIAGVTSDEEANDASPRGVRTHAMLHADDDDHSEPHCEDAAPTYPYLEDEDGGVTPDCELDVFGIPIPGTSQRNKPFGMHEPCDATDDEDMEDEAADGLSNCWTESNNDICHVRRNLLPQLVAFVASSPSKLDLSGLLC